MKKYYIYKIIFKLRYIIIICYILNKLYIIVLNKKLK